MNRLNTVILGVVLTGSLGSPAWSQSKSTDNPCAEYETAPKGETGAAKKARLAKDKKCKKKAKKEKKAAAKKPGTDIT